MEAVLPFGGVDQDRAKSRGGVMTLRIDGGVQLAFPYGGQAPAGIKHNGAGLAPRTHGGRHVPITHKKPAVRGAEPAVDPIEKRSPASGRNIGRLVIGGTLAVTGIILAGGGMLMTVNYTVATATGLDRILLAGLAAGSDLLALLMPTAAACLWRIRRRAAAAVAGILWIIAAGATLQNLCGFVGSYGDSFISGRESASTERSLVFDRLDRLRRARKEITETRSVAEINIAIRNATARKIDDERAAVAVAKHRDELDAQLAALEATIPTLPAMTAADPSAATIAGIVSLISGGQVVIADDTFRKLRLALLLVLPLLAGPILGLATATLAGERRP
jgi:hypothetical protein